MKVCQQDEANTSELSQVNLQETLEEEIERAEVRSVYETRNKVSVPSRKNCKV